MSNRNTGNTMDMSQGVIWRQILRFAVPTAVGILFQQMYNVADALIVGRFVSKEALAAVGATGSITNMMIGLSTGLSTGASVITAQCYGAKDTPNLRKAVHVTMLMTAVLGAVSTVLGILLVDPMLRLMQTPADIFQEARTYLLIYFLSLGALFLYNSGAAILRALGDSKRPLYFLCASSGLHILLDILFVKAFQLGVAGVAWATLITQVFSAVLIFWALLRDGTPYRLRLSECKLDGAIAKRILSVGLPSGLQQALSSFSLVYIQSAINSFGSTVIAAWTVHSKLDSLLLIPQEAIGLACGVFVGQNYGAHQTERIRRCVRRSILISSSATVAAVVLMLLNARPVVALFNSDPGVIDYSIRIMCLVIPWYLVSGLNVIYASALRGTGHAKISSVMTLLSYVALRQIYLLAVQNMGNQFEAVIFVYPLGWAVSCISHWIYYHTKIFPGKRESAVCTQRNIF